MRETQGDGGLLGDCGLRGGYVQLGGKKEGIKEKDQWVLERNLEMILKMVMLTD